MRRFFTVLLVAILAILASSTGAQAHTVYKPTKTWTVKAYEDGSGHVYRHGREVQSMGADVFPWDCNQNGNRRCGPTAPASVRGYKCVEVDIPRYRTTLRYCTDGEVTVKRGHRR